MLAPLLVRLRPSPRLFVLSALSTLTMWLGQGCARVNNDRLTIGGEPVATLGPAEEAERLAPAAGPSLEHGSRDHWPSESIRVPVDPVEHRPRFTRAQPNYSDTPRDAGRHPTAGSALELSVGPAIQAWEAIAAPFHAAADFVLFIPRAIDEPPCAVVHSPATPRERAR
jgi:hypothetical protein